MWVATAKRIGLKVKWVQLFYAHVKTSDLLAEVDRVMLNDAEWWMMRLGDRLHGTTWRTMLLLGHALLKTELHWASPTKECHRIKMWPCTWEISRRYSAHHYYAHHSKALGCNSKLNELPGFTTLSPLFSNSKVFKNKLSITCSTSDPNQLLLVIVITSSCYPLDIHDRPSLQFRTL